MQQALGELAGTAKEGLLTLSVGAGLGVLHEIMCAKVGEHTDPGGCPDPDRWAVRHGTQEGLVTLGGRRLPLERLRVCGADGSGEVPLRTYRHFAECIR